VRLGKVNVERDILRAITAKQFRGWEHFDELYPMIGEDRTDYRIASIVQILYNINRGKDQKALPISDFVLKFDGDDEKKRQKQTADQQFRIMQLWAAAMASDGPAVPKVIEVGSQEQDALDKARAAMKTP